MCLTVKVVLFEETKAQFHSLQEVHYETVLRLATIIIYVALSYLANESMVSI